MSSVDRFDHVVNLGFDFLLPRSKVGRGEGGRASDEAEFALRAEGEQGLVFAAACANHHGTIIRWT